MRRRAELEPELEVIERDHSARNLVVGLGIVALVLTIGLPVARQFWRAGNGLDDAGGGGTTTATVEALAPPVDPEPTEPLLNCSLISGSARDPKQSELMLAGLAINTAGETVALGFDCPAEGSFSRVARYSGQIAGQPEGVGLCVVVQVGAWIEGDRTITAVCEGIV